VRFVPAEQRVNKKLKKDLTTLIVGWAWPTVNRRDRW